MLSWRARWASLMVSVDWTRIRESLHWSILGGVLAGVCGIMLITMM